MQRLDLWISKFHCFNNQPTTIFRNVFWDMRIVNLQKFQKHSTKKQESSAIHMGLSSKHSKTWQFLARQSLRQVWLGDRDLLSRNDTPVTWQSLGNPKQNLSLSSLYIVRFYMSASERWAKYEWCRTGLLRSVFGVGGIRLLKPEKMT